MRGIKELLIAIIIFSESYASSSWCLEELVKTLECKKMNEQVVMHSTKWNPGK